MLLYRGGVGLGRGYRCSFQMILLNHEWIVFLMWTLVINSSLKETEMCRGYMALPPALGLLVSLDYWYASCNMPCRLNLHICLMLYLLSQVVESNSGWSCFSENTILVYSLLNLVVFCLEGRNSIQACLRCSHPFSSSAQQDSQYFTHCLMSAPLAGMRIHLRV